MFGLFIIFIQGVWYCTYRFWTTPESMRWVYVICHLFVNLFEIVLLLLIAVNKKSKQINMLFKNTTYKF